MIEYPCQCTHCHASGQFEEGKRIAADRILEWLRRDDVNRRLWSMPADGMPANAREIADLLEREVIATKQARSVAPRSLLETNIPPRTDLPRGSTASK